MTATLVQVFLIVQIACEEGVLGSLNDIGDRA